MVAFLAIAIAGLVALALVGAEERRTLAFTLGVRPEGIAVLLRPGQVACQGPIAASTAFDAVELLPGTYRQPGPPLEVTITRGGITIGRGALGGGYTDNALQDVAVGHVSATGEITACLRNIGTRKVGLWGGSDAMAPTSTATLDRRRTATDVRLTFRRREARSTLALIPELLERASLFRAAWIGQWLYWLLLGGVVLLVPALIGRALRSAAVAEEPPRLR